MIACRFRQFATIKRAAVILSGAGNMDGSDLHEASAAMIALSHIGIDYQCFAPDQNQAHVINHLNGSTMQASVRNTLVESARIDSQVKCLSAISDSKYDMLIMPGGKGLIKNLSDYELKNDKFEVSGLLEQIIMEFYQKHKILALCCISPLIVGKVLSKHKVKASLSVGGHGPEWKNQDPIKTLLSLGHNHLDTQTTGFSIDHVNRILCTPCYMNSLATPKAVFRGITGMITQAYLLIDKQLPRPVVVNKKLKSYKTEEEKQNKIYDPKPPAKEKAKPTQKQKPKESPKESKSSDIKTDANKSKTDKKVKADKNIKQTPKDPHNTTDAKNPKANDNGKLKGAKDKKNDDKLKADKAKASDNLERKAKKDVIVNKPKEVPQK
jgi:enhancing lycopene biosynthesis protein 2